MSADLLIIGLDGGTYDLLLPLIEQGVMPNLARLLPKGSWGQLESTIPPFTAAAWSSFATGKNPGKHGILSFQQTDRFQYHEQTIGLHDARRLKRPLWALLSDAGKRVAVLNVPMSYPPLDVNGIMITGMMTPANASNYTFPPGLLSKYPEYRIDVDFIREGESFRRYGLPPKKEMLADIQAVTEQRTAVAHQLLQQEAWDFFMVVYTGTDRVSHFFWDDLESILQVKSAPQKTTSPHQAALIEYFENLDKDIATLVAEAGSETDVVFMSDHGFGPAPTKRFAVNLWLEQLKLLAAKTQTQVKSLAYWRMKIGRNRILKQIVRRLISQQMQDNLAQKAEANSGDSGINWGATRAFFVPIYFNVCGIEINTTSHHREGIVDTDDVYEALRTQIIAAAKRLVDPETSTPIVDLVARREEVFDGSYVADFPDIIMILKPEYVGGGSLAASQLIEQHIPFRSGEHRPDGIFAAIGPHVQSIADVPALNLVDISATVLYLLNVPIPDDFDGRILYEILNPGYLENNPPRFQQVQAKEDEITSDTLYSQDEEAEIVERLRSLGYME